jgi:hypothetical protein
MSLLPRFYAAFARRNWAEMGSCYHPEARFSDPIFPALDAGGVKAMWRVLLTAGTDLKLSFQVLEEHEHGGRVRWNAWYTFGQSGRKVHNLGISEFRFRDGLIIDQQDRFDLWRWSRQALGLKGVLLGWSPWMERRIRASAAKRLAKARKKFTGPPSPTP